MTGFEEPEAYAVLTKRGTKRKFTLFVPPRDPARKKWDGDRAGIEGAKKRFRADKAYSNKELDHRLKEIFEKKYKRHFMVEAFANKEGF